MSQVNVEPNQTNLNDGIPENGIATMLTYTGWTVVALGILLGLFLGTESYTEFSFIPFIICGASGFVSGILIVGLGEIVKQSFIINQRLKTHGYKFEKEK